MDFLAATRGQSAAKHAASEPQHQSSQAYQSLHQRYTSLQEQHEKLKQHLAAMSETVRVLGDQSSHTTKVAQEAQDYKLDLLTKHSKLQQQCKGLKDTVETLNRNFEAANEKLFLQNQLHENKMRTVEATHNTLKERCKSMAVTAEQHRLANLQLETRNKSMTKDIEKLAELHASAVLAKDRDMHALQSKLSKLEADFTHLKATNARLQSEADLQSSASGPSLRAHNDKISSLEGKIKSHASEAKRLQATDFLLKAHPVDIGQHAKTRNILSSSAEILQLAHSNGSVDSMRECLGQVAAVLMDLNGQLGSQYTLSKAWLEQVEKL